MPSSSSWCENALPCASLDRCSRRQRSKPRNWSIRWPAKSVCSRLEAAFPHAGPQAVRLIQELGGEIFLDLKFHDIPNTVAKAAIEATRLGVKMFNVHASGSLEMMRLTVKEVQRVCRQEQRRRPIMLAVTVLTSLNQDDLKRVGVTQKVAAQVERLALLTKEAGMDGVDTSPHEVADIREACGRRFVIITPGIRQPMVSEMTNSAS